MIGLIETLFGSKVGRLIAEIVLVLALIGAAILHFEHKGATDELGKLQKSSTALLNKAHLNIQHEIEWHAIDVKANQERTDAALAATADVESRFAQRVRDFDAYRRAHPDVPRAAGGPVAAQPGECGARSCGDLASELAKAGDELAGSQGQLIATLQSCQRDRDSLTGLPKDSP